MPARDRIPAAVTSDRPLNVDDRIFRFGAFEVDLRSGEVRKKGVRIKVQGQPLKVLVLLLERSGEVITREELRQRLWPDNTFVDFEHGLNSALTRLRQVLTDSAETPRYIETVPRQGYRFVASVVQESGAGRTPSPSNHALPVRPQPTIAGPEYVGIMIAVLVVAVYGGLTALRSPSHKEPQMVLEQFTRDLGLSTDPAISADGKLLAYASDQNSKHLNIWLKQLSPGGKSIQLTHFDADARQPAFSPDGSRIAFRGEGDRSGIYVVSSIGGEPVHIADFGRNPRFSPDGNWIAFWVDAFSAPSSGTLTNGAVYVIRASGGSAKQVGPEGSGYPVWAPDSQHLLVYKMRPESNVDWWVVPLNGSSPIRAGVFAVLKNQGFSLEMGMPLPVPAVWSSDHVIFSAKRGDTVNIWRISLTQKDPHARAPAQQLTYGTGRDVNPSLAAGGSLVFASLTEHTSIWSLALEPNQVQVTGDLQRITESTASDVTPSATPDGRYVAYTSDRAQSQDVYLRDLETGKEVALASTADPEWHPIISGDGSLVAYTDRGANPGIYIAPARGGTAEKVTDGTGFVWAWSQDNRGLLFKKDHSTHDIRIFDFSSKKESVFLHRDGVHLYQAKFSPDGQWLALEAIRAYESGSRLYVLPLKDGKPGGLDSWIPIVDANGWADKPRWSPDGNTLYFIDHRDGFRCIWAQPLNEKTKRPSGPALAVHHFHGVNLSLANVDVTVLEIDVARNRLFLTVGELGGNIWGAHIPDNAAN